MKFTNAELMQRKREGKKLRGVKEIRGVYAEVTNHDQIKKLTIEFVKSLNDNCKQFKGE